MTLDPRPTVSVVIPTYNYGRYICETIDSALAQTYKPLEVIVVDDGSTDDTRERLAAYSDRIRYILQKNSGPAAARNTGIVAAQGEFVALLDSDDLWLPEKVERQVALYLREQDAGIVATQRFAIDETGQRLDYEVQRTEVVDGILRFEALALLRGREAARGVIRMRG